MGDANRGETSIDKLSSHNLMEPVQDLSNDLPSINQSINAYAAPYPVQESDSDSITHCISLFDDVLLPCRSRQ